MITFTYESLFDFRQCSFNRCSHHWQQQDSKREGAWGEFAPSKLSSLCTLSTKPVDIRSTSLHDFGDFCLLTCLKRPKIASTSTAFDIFIVMPLICVHSNDHIISTYPYSGWHLKFCEIQNKPRPHIHFWGVFYGLIFVGCLYWAFYVTIFISRLQKFISNNKIVGKNKPFQVENTFSVSIPMTLSTCPRFRML